MSPTTPNSLRKVNGTVHSGTDHVIVKNFWFTKDGEVVDYGAEQAKTCSDFYCFLVARAARPLRENVLLSTTYSPPERHSVLRYPYDEC